MADSRKTPKALRSYKRAINSRASVIKLRTNDEIDKDSQNQQGSENGTPQQQLQEQKQRRPQRKGSKVMLLSCWSTCGKKQRNDKAELNSNEPPMSPISPPTSPTSTTSPHPSTTTGEAPINEVQPSQRISTLPENEKEASSTDKAVDETTASASGSEDDEADSDSDEREKPEDAALLVRLTKGDEVTILDKWGKKKNRVVFIDDRTTVLRKFSHSLFAVDGTKRLISLREVANIIDGAHTEAFHRHALKGMENRCFSLVFGNGCKTVDFLCSDQGVKKAWVHGLTLIIARLMPTVQTAEDIAQSYFQLADVNGDGRLSVDEVCQLVKRLHLNLERRHIKDLFKMVEADSTDENKDNHLDRTEFLKFVRILYHCTEIENIYQSAKGGNDYLNAANFSAFLSAHQKEVLQQSAVEKVMRNNELSVSLRGLELLSYEGFRSYLMSDENSISKIESLTLYQDMTQPMTSYWIFSSHNTYLIGNQLTGESSTNGYTSALTRGCRCVEIDSWDGDDGEPIVTHGHTLTSKLLFVDVIKAIKDAAFVTSSYPVIVSLENHCSVKQQQRMAEHMKAIFGDALATSLVDPADPNKVLSPEALRHRFIIKGKTNSLHQSASKTYSTSTTMTKQGSSSVLAKTNSLTESNSAGEDSSLNISAMDQSSSVTASNNNGNNNNNNSNNGGRVDASGGKTARELSDITAMGTAKFDLALSKSIPVGSVSSLVESEIHEIANRGQLEQLINYTDRYFIRVYPAGLRTNSSNYNPMFGVMGGCQLVALNFQTPDKYYKMYNGFFADNGYTGYILKQISAPLSPPMTLRIQVISGYQLGKSDQSTVRDILDPYVIVRLYGVSEDEARFQTTVVNNNGFNPIWKECFTFRVSRPDIALLRFIIMDDNVGRNNFIAQCSIPVRLVRPGFRYVRLDSEHSTCSSLLVNITIA